MFSGAKLALGYVLTSIMRKYMERETHLNLDFWAYWAIFRMSSRMVSRVFLWSNHLTVYLTATPCFRSPLFKHFDKSASFTFNVLLCLMLLLLFCKHIDVRLLGFTVSVFSHISFKTMKITKMMTFFRRMRAR